MLALDHYYEICPALVRDLTQRVLASRRNLISTNIVTHPWLCRAGLSRRGKGCDSKIRPVTVLGWGDLPFDQQVCVNRQHPAPVGQGRGFGSPGTCDRE